MATDKTRDVVGVIPGREVMEGAGVRVRRYIGSPELDHIDPFLLLDEMRSDDPRDYVAGFPPHPHRGFQTLTYMMHGRFRHEDSTGSAGTLSSGGLQWMNAGSGVIHSEMPKMRAGRLWGYQLWLNAPSRERWSDPFYRNFKAREIRDGDVQENILAGEDQDNFAFFPMLYTDVHLEEGASFERVVPKSMNAFVVVAEGEVAIGPQRRRVGQHNVALLGEGEAVSLEAGSDTVVILGAGEPVRESIARWGPFVMNTREEILQAITDYQHGRLVKKKAEDDLGG
ncbi:MAG: pirin family protein [Thermoplasmata archaeon]